MKEQENLKSTVLKLYSAGSKVSDIVTQTGTPRSTISKNLEQLDSYN